MQPESVLAQLNNLPAMSNVLRPTLLLIGACVLLLSACSSSGPSVTSAPGPGDPGAAETVFPPAYKRVVEPFEVLKEDGSAHLLPFLGGFNVPRPQFYDIDADGDVDLFIQEETGSIVFLENTGTVGNPRYVWRTDKYQNLDVGEWYRFVDLDGDGDVDILSEQKYSYVKYFRNEGSAEEARFVAVVDTLRDAEGVPLFADRQNIPNLVDIDCDGLIDLFIGRITGTITRYESVGMDEFNVPRFKFVTDNFEDIEIIGEAQTRHGANTLAFADMDGDGDQDLFWGDFFEPGLLFIRNLGSCAFPSLRSEPEPWPLNNPVETSGYNAPAIIDYDLDGDLDVLFGVLGGAFNAIRTTAENLYFMENMGSNEFEVRTNRFVDMIDVGSESIVKFADLDGDGDQDMYVMNKIRPETQKDSQIFYYENVGTASAPSFVMRGLSNFEATYHQNPEFADLDGDGDLDVLLGKWNRDLSFFRNVGTATSPSFELVDDKFVSLTRGQNSSPALADMDNDGDLDLFVGEASGTLNYYRNEGSATLPNFVLVSDKYNDIDVGRRSFPTLVDIDGDGDYDLIVGSELNGARLFMNVGTAEEMIFEDSGKIEGVRFQTLVTPEFVDIDDDGDLDLFAGGSSGGVQFFENPSR